MKMSVKTAAFAALLMSLCVGSAQARDDTYFLPIKAALETGEAQEKLGGDIKFYFGDQPHPDVEATLKQGYVVYKKARASRSDWDKEESELDKLGCDRTMLTILRVFQAHALKRGGNAVINIESYYKNNVFRSKDQFECHAGDSGSGVVLRGDIVKLKQ